MSLEVLMISHEMKFMKELKLLVERYELVLPQNLTILLSEKMPDQSLKKQKNYEFLVSVLLNF